MINKDVFRLKKNGEPYCNCFCRTPELIENYDKAIADNTQTWECHHRREELFTQKELVARGEYFDRPPEELIFLTVAEHNKVDSFCKRQSQLHKGKKHTEETKRKMSESHKGKAPSYERTPEIKAKNYTPERNKKISELKWWNNGLKNKRSKDCPGPEWEAGRLEAAWNKGKHCPIEQRQKISKTLKGREKGECYTNGYINRYFKDGEEIPEGWVKGMTREGHWYVKL